MSEDDAESDSEKIGSSVNTQTRRQALKTVGVASIGGLPLSGIAAGHGYTGESPEIGRDTAEAAPDWWLEKRASERAATSKSEITAEPNIELVRGGVDTWVSKNDEAPDWFTIGEEDELSYKPHGAFRTDQAELCLPTSVDIGPATVGLEACHYGGCEWKVEACLAACVGTGMNDDCEGKFNLGVDLGVVSGGLTIFPSGERIGTAVVLTEIDIEGELCYYYVLGSNCHTVSVGWGF